MTMSFLTVFVFLRIDHGATALRIDTGGWDVIGVVACISCSTPHILISNTPYERTIFLLLNYMKHVNIN